VKGGGAYFIISRTLGIEFGGAFGLVMFFSLVACSALNIVGITDLLQAIIPSLRKIPTEINDLPFNSTSEIQSTINALSNTNDSSSSSYTLTSQQHDAIIIAIQLSILLICALIVILGPNILSHTNNAILIITIAVVGIIIGFFAFQGKKDIKGFDDIEQQELTIHLSNWSLSQFRSNFWPKFGKFGQFLAVFSVAMPMFTNIFVGLNMSGDLRNPKKDIPFGTLIAILSCSTIYILTILVLGFKVDRNALQKDYFILAHPSLVYTGIIISSLGGALGSLITASRIIQAVGEDNIFSSLSWILRKDKDKLNDDKDAVILRQYNEQQIKQEIQGKKKRNQTIGNNIQFGEDSNSSLLLSDQEESEDTFSNSLSSISDFTPFQTEHPDQYPSPPIQEEEYEQIQRDINERNVLEGRVEGDRNVNDKEKEQISKGIQGIQQQEKELLLKKQKYSSSPFQPPPPSSDEPKSLEYARQRRQRGGRGRVNKFKPLTQQQKERRKDQKHPHSHKKEDQQEGEGQGQRQEQGEQQYNEEEDHHSLQSSVISPLRSVLFSSLFVILISSFCTFIDVGGNNAIAALTSIFNMGAYLLANISCFIHTILGVPNWRIWKEEEE
ncbi:MAG: putative Nucleolar GTP-binding protein 2, partial [Streblomastix strix]